ncbi:MAG: hypothetical protein HYR84_15150 [Planctomycetes bacterium]|nr:hypothetical protein [Planctomycetota bacterium]
MNFRSIVMSTLLCTLALSPTADGQGKGKGNKMAAAQNGWLFSFSEAKRQGAATGKPIMVVIRCEP